MIDVKIKNGVLSESYGISTISKINIGRITGGSSATNNKITVSTGYISNKIIGANATSIINIGYVGDGASNNTINVTTGKITNENDGVSTNSQILIGESMGSGTINVSTGDIYQKLIAANSVGKIYVGYNNDHSNSHNITAKTGNITQSINGTAMTSSSVMVGAILPSSTYNNNNINVTTKNITSNLNASVDWNSGVYVGVCNSTDCSSLSGSSGSLDASGTACMDGIGCWDELTGNSSCIVINSHGIDNQCGNTDMINEAMTATEQYWDDIEQAADEAADAAADAADDVWKDVKNWF